MVKYNPNPLSHHACVVYKGMPFDWIYRLVRFTMRKFMPDGITVGELHFHLSESDCCMDIYWFIEDFLLLISIERSDNLNFFLECLSSRKSSFWIGGGVNDYCGLEFTKETKGYRITQIFQEHPKVSAKTRKQMACVFEIKPWCRIDALVWWLEVQIPHLRAIEKVEV